VVLAILRPERAEGLAVLAVHALISRGFLSTLLVLSAQLLLRSVHPDREHPIQVVFREDPEGDERLGGRDAGDPADAFGHHLGKSVVRCDPDDGNEVVPPGDGVDLTDAVRFGECLRDAIRGVTFDIEQHDGSYHGRSLLKGDTKVHEEKEKVREGRIKRLSVELRVIFAGLRVILFDKRDAKK